MDRPGGLYQQCNKYANPSAERPSADPMGARGPARFLQASPALHRPGVSKSAALVSPRCRGRRWVGGTCLTPTSSSLGGQWHWAGQGPTGRTLPAPLCGGGGDGGVASVAGGSGLALPHAHTWLSQGAVDDADDGLRPLPSSSVRWSPSMTWTDTFPSHTWERL